MMAATETPDALRLELARLSEKHGELVLQHGLAVAALDLANDKRAELLAVAALDGQEVGPQLKKLTAERDAAAQRAADLAQVVHAAELRIAAARDAACDPGGPSRPRRSGPTSPIR